MILENVSLKSYNSFSIDAKARYFCEINHVEQLKELLSNHCWKKIPKLILGEGSNILLTQDFDGLVLKNRINGIEKIKEDSDHVWVTAGAGENWHHFVMYCIENGYGGVENLSLIPGTVGAAPMQNIGAYGVEINQVFDSLTALNIENTKTQVFLHQECQFGYRESIFKNRIKNQFIITDVTFRLSKKPHFHIEYGALKQLLSGRPEELNIKVISDAVIQIRTQKLPDPKVIGNAGSFFKNPIVPSVYFEKLRQQFPEIPHFPVDTVYYKVPAAWLIEQCQWKGYRQGDIGVHQHHALVLVNYGQGKGKDLYQLALEIQRSVLEKFSIEILPEVNII